jgi:protein arginine N-methyltransferase 5
VNLQAKKNPSGHSWVPEKKMTFSVGLEVSTSTDLNALNSIAVSNGYHFAVSKILFNAPSILKNTKLIPAALPKDVLVIDNAENSSFIAGCVSEWVELDSEDHLIRQKSERIVRKEIEWASHIGLISVIFTIPKGNIANFARVLNWAVDFLAYTSVFVRVSVKNWERWNMVRMMCGHHHRLGVVLEMDKEYTPKELNKWEAEPVRCLQLSTAVFLENKKGFPVLSKNYQQFLFRMFRSTQKLIVTTSGFNCNHKGDFSSYLQYLEHLFEIRPEDSIIDQFAAGYHDCLQAPLQPLMDNLESGTYEVFEKDPVKYQEYENATYKALMDRKSDDAMYLLIYLVL